MNYNYNNIHDNYIVKWYDPILDFNWTVECIHFTTMCVFYSSVTPFGSIQFQFLTLNVVSAGSKLDKIRTLGGQKQKSKVLLKIAEKLIIVI